MSGIDWNKAPGWAGAVVESKRGVQFWVSQFGGTSARQRIGSLYPEENARADMTADDHGWLLIENRPFQAWNGEGLPPVSILHENLVYEKETGTIFKRKKKNPACYTVKKKNKTYLKVRLLGRSFYAHRVAWAMHHGAWPSLEIDHINGDSEDNCILNLREVSRKQNCQNVKTSINSASGYCGVNWHSLSGKWRARVKMNGREHYVGLFDCPETAAKAISEKRNYLGFHPEHGAAHVVYAEEIPIRTPEQIAVDERSKECDRIYGILSSVDRPGNKSDMAEAIYDAGLRFTEPAK